MKISGRETEAVTDVCDVCDSSTHIEGGGNQCGRLQAHWGDGSQHYDVRLCEGCFFKTIAFLKQEHRIENLFSGQADSIESFGVVTKDRFLKVTAKLPSGAERSDDA